MGGMSAFLPVSSMSEEEAKAVMLKVLADKTNELAQGNQIKSNQTNPNPDENKLILKSSPDLLLLGCEGEWIAC